MAARAARAREARRPDRAGARRQQGAQAGVPVRRSAGERRRRARHRRRGAEQPRPDDRGGGQPTRVRLPPRGRREGAASLQRQPAARSRPRRHAALHGSGLLLRGRDGDRAGRS